MIHKGGFGQACQRASNGVQRVGKDRLSCLHGLEHGDIVSITIIEHLACGVRELVLEEREEILIGSQFRVGTQLRGEHLEGEARQALPNDRLVQVLDFTHTVLHAVTGIFIDSNRTGSDTLHRHRIIALENQGRIVRLILWLTLSLLLFHLLLGQTQRQLTILEIEELTAAVGGAHQEVVEALVVLHQVGLYELTRGRTVLIHQELQPAKVCIHQGLIFSTFAKLQTLRLEDFRAQLTAHVGLAVLVERHQLVHTEDVQLHVHLRRVTITLQQRIHLIHEAVVGKCLD